MSAATATALILIGGCALIGAGMDLGSGVLGWTGVGCIVVAIDRACRQAGRR